MLEMIVFAITLVVVQILGYFIIMEIVLSKGFIKKFAKKYMNLVDELTEEMFKKDEES